MKKHIVTFHAYCGMSHVVAKGVTRARAKEIIRNRIRNAKASGQPVTKIGKGEWEFETPEDAFMVSDDDGILIMRRYGAA